MLNTKLKHNRRLFKMFLDLLHKTEESTKKGCVIILRMFRFVNKTPSQNKNKAKTLFRTPF